MRKFGRAAVTAAGAVSLASLASLLSITVPASAYTTGSAAPAPAATRLGTLARIKPGGPMALPRNQSSAPRAFYGKTINVVSQNWGGYVAQRHGVKFRYVRAAFFVPYVDCASTPSSFSGHWWAWMHGEQQRGGARPAHPDLPWEGVRLLLDAPGLTLPRG